MIKRSTVKRIAAAAAVAATTPTYVFYMMKAGLIGHGRAYAGLSQKASRWEGTLGIYLRRALFCRVIAKMGRDVVISYGTLLNRRSVELGDNVYIGGYSILGDVRVGKHTLIADHVTIPSGAGQHGIRRLDVPVRDQPGQTQVIRIGEDCWIGSNAVVMADVGRQCIVAAGAVVTSKVDDYKIVAGSPARVIGDRREVAARALVITTDCAESGGTEHPGHQSGSTD